MSFAPAAVVEGQPRTALPFGLFSVLSPRPEGDGRWQNGIEWEALTCEPAGGIATDCDPETPDIGLPKDFVGGNTNGEASPFTVYGSYSCTPAGRPSLAYAQERATEHLLAREEARVEQALWTGDLANGGFATGAASVGTGLSIVRAVAALEGWLATNYGSLGVIHMTRETALIAVKEGVVEKVGNRLVTKIGTPVVAGAGYTGTGPDGAAPADGATFIYATPALLGYRSEVFAGADPVAAGFDRTSNDLYAVAERTYVVGFDPCGSAVAGVTF